MELEEAPEARGVFTNRERVLGSFNPCRDGIAENLFKTIGGPAADQSLGSAFNTLSARPLLLPSLTLNMKPITSISAFILLQIAVLPCFAKSGRRSNPPALDNISLPSTLRITALKGGPFISSFNLLPCLVDMLRTSFDAIWLAPDQQMNLHDNRYLCSENRLTLNVVSLKLPLKGMEYSDLVMLATMLLNFQQVYMLPGIEFQYMAAGQVTGTGYLSYNQAKNDLNQE